jgi:hypothetical protein
VEPAPLAFPIKILSSTPPDLEVTGWFVEAPPLNLTMAPGGWGAEAVQSSTYSAPRSHGPQMA